MRQVLLLIGLVFQLSTSLDAQSTLSFSREFTPNDLSSTGIAIVNPTNNNASAVFTLRNKDGGIVATNAQIIPSGGQLAKLGSELFPGVITSGWIQVTSNSTGLQGFWLGGDFKTYTDGGTAASSAKTLVLPIVTTDTEINITNTTNLAGSATLSLRNETGTELESSTRTIASMGILKQAASSIFTKSNLSQATHIHLNSNVLISVTAILKDFLVQPSWGAINGIDASETTTQLNFAHVISGSGGGGNWLTQIGVANLSSSNSNVTITFNELNGEESSIQRTIPGNGSLRESAESLFALSSENFQDGWVQVTSTSAITGFVAYADSTARGLAIVPAQSTGLTQMLFAHIAQATDWLTGVALLNTSSSTANVEIYAMNPDGTLIGGAKDSPSASFNLAPNKKVAKIINDPWIPNAKTNGGFVFVRTTNGVPIFGIELFFLSNLALLANVSPGALATGISYTPPPSISTVTLTSLSPSTITRGQELTLHGQGFNAMGKNAAVLFSTLTGTAQIAPNTVTNNHLTVTVPSSAISGPVLVHVGSSISSSLIIEITTSSSELVQSSITVTSGKTTSDVDIYVPTPRSNLNLTSIGSFEIGMNPASYFTSISPVELTRGQSKELVVVGTDINAANGSTLRVSGSGVTISNFRFRNNLMIVQVDIAPTALPGPRSVIVTNLNLDTSVLSGGLIIK